MLKSVVAIAAAAIVLALAVPDLASRLLEPQRAEQEASPSGEANAARVMLTADRRGHFATEMAVNGRPLTALVDTGASAVTLTYEDGRVLGLIRPGDRYDIEVRTANGTTGAKRVLLNTVRIGGISMTNVEAMIAREGVLAVNLLGMSFLKRLRAFEIQNGRLTLEQ